jgi:hypothetical protein
MADDCDAFHLVIDHSFMSGTTRTYLPTNRTYTYYKEVVGRIDISKGELKFVFLGTTDKALTQIIY